VRGDRLGGNTACRRRGKTGERCKLAGPEKVLIISIGINADRKKMDLILARHAFKTVPASELGDIKGLD
jgi:hypothetical protein